MQAAQFFGLKAAPAYITRTAAQQRMAELAAENREGGGQAAESHDRSKARRELVSAVARRDPAAR